MVHLSLLLTLHGSGIDGELCRTVSFDFQVICRQKFLHAVISVEKPFINLRIKASRAPPAGGGGMYMWVFPRETFQAFSSSTRKLVKSSISKVPPTKTCRKQKPLSFWLLTIQVCGDCSNLLLLYLWLNLVQSCRCRMHQLLSEQLFPRFLQAERISGCLLFPKLFCLRCIRFCWQCKATQRSIKGDTNKIKVLLHKCFSETSAFSRKIPVNC